MERSERIHEKGLAVGYSHIGALEFADIENEAIEKIRQDYPWSKSMIIAAFHYNFYKIPTQLEGKVSKRDLFQGRYFKQSHENDTATEFETFLSNEAIQHVDMTSLSSPVKNSIAAEMGIGRTRRNGYFYTEDGSYCHLHAWLVDAELTCDYDEPPTECPEHCSICTRNCPEKALTRVSKDTDKCIAFQTDIIVENFTVGCDQCQDLCPFNKHRWEHEEEYIGLKYE